MYDYLIVGSGLFGSIFAYEAKRRGKTCLVIEKRSHWGGNIYCEQVEGINVHQYGAHIFHTSDSEVWAYINQFVDFNNFVNSPLANYKGELYNLPFNMNTFYQLWGTKTPLEAKKKIAEQIENLNITEPKNLEEQALKLVGTDIYYKLIKEYTEKQWNRNAEDLPAFIIRRLPVRFRYDNNYFNDNYQGIPIDGYNKIIEKLLDGIEVRLNTDFFANRDELQTIGKKIVFTGLIDQYFDYRYGKLDYRSLAFQHEKLSVDSFQGVAVVNYTDKDTPYTRIIEHKHFEFGQQPTTVITKEYPADWEVGMEPYYPINDERNNALAAQYLEAAKGEENVIFGGRLADYKYYDMDKVVRRAIDVVSDEFDD